MGSADNLKFVKEGDPVSASQYNLIVSRLKAMARSLGPGQMTLSDGTVVSRPLIQNDPDALFTLARLTDAGDEDGDYIAEEVRPDPESRGDWLLVDGGFTWGATSGDQGKLLHPLGTAGLEEGDGDQVYLVYRTTDEESESPLWVIVSGGGSSLPAGSGQYKVLQLDAADAAIWDYVRAH